MNATRNLVIVGTLTLLLAGGLYSWANGNVRPACQRVAIARGWHYDGLDVPALSGRGYEHGVRIGACRYTDTGGKRQSYYPDREFHRFKALALAAALQLELTIPVGFVVALAYPMILKAQRQARHLTQRRDQPDAATT